MATNIEGETIRYVRCGLFEDDNELLARELGIRPQMMTHYERKGAARWMRLALIGLLVTNGKPYGILWPEH